MSNPNEMHSAEPSDKKILISAMGWVGVFLLFLLIVIIAYVPNQSSSLEEINTQERLAIKKEVFATQQNLVSSYGWENQAEGIVRIPVDRAMELALKEIQEKQKGVGSQNP